MVAPSAREVVLVLFPFSDLSQAKLRPAVVLANTDRARGDHVMCQITSNPYGDRQAVEITDNSFIAGSLNRVSYARPSKLFTANQSLITSPIGNLKPDFFNRLIESVVFILRSGVTQ
ncbi:MAG: type II toxin-antitoxin system PemK/MazF family toxin [Chloroflexi bacterium]|nr:type II toxin-antitoxin system PemK/MazF family toxin [Chloroflexota bacterium]